MLIQKTGDKDVDGNFKAVTDEIDKLGRVAIMRGRRVENVSLPDATDVEIKHLLGRSWTGYYITRMEGAAAGGYVNHRPGTSPATGYDHTTLLRLRATGFGATITIDLWVF